MAVAAAGGAASMGRTRGGALFSEAWNFCRVRREFVKKAAGHDNILGRAGRHGDVAADTTGVGGKGHALPVGTFL